METKKEPTQPKVGENAVKLVGEALIPGMSLLLDGQVLAGGAHLVVGTVARIALGPLGHALVAMNSFTQSVTGKNILKHFAKKEAQPAAKAATP